MSALTWALLRTFVKIKNRNNLYTTWCRVNVRLFLWPDSIIFHYSRGTCIDNLIEDSRQVYSLIPLNKWHVYFAPVGLQNCTHLNYIWRTCNLPCRGSFTISQISSAVSNNWNIFFFFVRKNLLYTPLPVVSNNLHNYKRNLDQSAEFLKNLFFEAYIRSGRRV